MTASKKRKYSFSSTDSPPTNQQPIHSLKSLPISRQKSDFLLSFLQIHNNNQQQNSQNVLSFSGFKAYPNHDNLMTSPYWGNQHEISKILLVCGPPGCCKKSLLYSCLDHLGVQTRNIHVYHSGSVTNGGSREELRTFEEFLHSWGEGGIVKRSRGIFRKGGPKQIRHDTNQRGSTSTNSSHTSSDVFIVEQMPSIHQDHVKERVFELLRKYTGYDAVVQARKQGQNTCRNPFASRQPLIIFHSIHSCPSVYSSLLRSFPQELLVGRFLPIFELRPITERRIEKILKEVARENERERRSQSSRKRKSSKYRTPSSDEIHSIAQKADGDLKQALQQLEFVQNMPPSKKRKKSKSSDADNTLTRDTYFDLFHATGKILYGKRTPDGDFDFDLNGLMHRVHSTEDGLINYAYHNMLHHFEDDAIEDVANTLDDMCIADSFAGRSSRDYAMQKSIYPAYSFQIASRGILYHNQHRAKPKMYQIRAPCLVKVEREATKSLLEGTLLFGQESNGEDGCGSLVDEHSVVEEVIPGKKLLKHPNFTPEQKAYVEKHQYTKYFSDSRNINENLESLGTGSREHTSFMDMSGVSPLSGGVGSSPKVQQQQYNKQNSHTARAPSPRPSYHFSSSRASPQNITRNGKSNKSPSPPPTSSTSSIPLRPSSQSHKNVSNRNWASHKSSPLSAGPHFSTSSPSSSLNDKKRNLPSLNQWRKTGRSLSAEEEKKLKEKDLIIIESSSEDDAF